MHLEVFKSKQKEILNKLNKFSNFYLVEGTGLALQIGHRTSDDFNMFTDKFLKKSFIKKAQEVFKNYNVQFTLRHSEQINLTVNSVSLSFVKYSYPLNFKLRNVWGIKIAAVKEIALMKVFTLGGRASLKDYVDLYFILKEGFMTLEEIIKGCQKKYNKEFNARLLLEELTYIQDVEKKNIEFLKDKVMEQDIKNFFKEQVKSYKNQITK